MANVLIHIFKTFAKFNCHCNVLLLVRSFREFGVLGESLISALRHLVHDADRRWARIDESKELVESVMDARFAECWFA